MLGFVCKVTNLDMWNKLRDAGLLMESQQTTMSFASCRR